MKHHHSYDIVLVNPQNHQQVYQTLAALSLPAIEPPVWAGLMATFVRQQGFSVQIVDAGAFNLTAVETAERVMELNPVLTVMVVYGHQPSASTQVMPAARAVCQAIKERQPQQQILFVGGHVAALPERTLREEKTDFVASGEGLYTMIELVALLKSGKSNYQKVRGLWYWENQQVKSNPPPPLVNTEEMPGVAWDLLPMNKYRAHNWHCFGDLQRQPYAALYTTLGCPFHCSFCCIQSPFKDGERESGIRATANSYRYWSPELVMTQIDTLVNQYGVRNLKIADEMFVLNRKHVLTICELLIERDYQLNIWAYARVDTVKDDFLLEKLKQAGFNWLAFGVEAGNDRVRKDVQKGIQQADIYQILSKVREFDIHVAGNYIFGLPEDDLQTMQQTLDLALELNCEYANFYTAMAYPGSSLYQLALQQGWPLPATWSSYSQHSIDTLPLPTKYLAASQVLQFRDRAFQIYFNNSQYLKLINDKFGPKTVQHIKEMAAPQLERKYVTSSP